MRVLVLGGRSEIGVALARRLAPGATVVLAARRSHDLDDEEQQLLVAGAVAVERVEFDADDLAAHEELLRRHPADVVVVAFGILGDQARAEQEPAHALEIAHTDYVAHVSVLLHAATIMRERGSGTLIVFSSVAGARVRRANFVYGGAKAGLDGFASGLADSLHGSGVRLLLVRPGFVIGRMTAGMTPAPFSSTPEQVVEATAAAFRAGRGEVWVPRVLQPIFAVLRHVPRALWRRMPR